MRKTALLGNGIAGIQTILLIVMACGTSWTKETPTRSATPVSGNTPAISPSAPVKKPKPVTHWTVQNRLSGTLTQTGVQAPEYSRDPAIKNQKNNWSYLLSYEHHSLYDHPKFELKNTVTMKYGQTALRYLDSAGNRVEYRQEIQDQITIDSLQAYKVLPNPKALFSSETYESAFTGNDAGGTGVTQYFTPRLLKLAVGYRANPIKNLNILTGLRGQDYFDDANSNWEFGLTGVVDYTYTIKKELAYTSKFEVFSELDDVSHVSMRFNNVIASTVSKYLTFKFTCLFYYETNPDDVVSADDRFYNSLSWIQTSRLSIVLAF